MIKQNSREITPEDQAEFEEIKSELESMSDLDSNQNKLQ